MRPPVAIDPDEVEFSAIRAQGPGGQNVNKVSNAVQARFDIGASSLPADVKERLRALPDARITRDGVVVIKAQSARSLERNRIDALARLQALVDAAATLGSQRRRLDAKAGRGQVKALRGKVHD